MRSFSCPLVSGLILFTIQANAAPKPKGKKAICAEALAKVAEQEGRPPHAVSRIARPVSVAALSKGNTDFGVSILSALIKPTENVIISPTSITSAWLMTGQGAVGATRAEMLHPLGLGLETQSEIGGGFKRFREQIEGTQDGAASVKISNALWLNDGVKVVPQFASGLEADFGAIVTTMDFSRPESLALLNQTVAKQTEQKIPQLLKKLGSSDSVVLTNAVILKGTWATEFDVKLTMPGIFRLAGGQEKKIPMMTRQGEMSFLDTDGVTGVSLPLGGDKMVVDFFLPTDGRLKEFVDTLNAERVAELTEKFAVEKGTVSMPRLNVEYETELAATLSDDLGISLPFGSNGDFSGMVQGGGVQISQVVHVVNVKLDELGVVAAAATAVRMTRGMPRPGRVVNLNSPYVMVIRSIENNVIHFIGAIQNPD